MGKFLDWLKELCCFSSTPLRIKITSACCDGEVIQMNNAENVQIQMRLRAHTI